MTNLHHLRYTILGQEDKSSFEVLSSWSSRLGGAVLIARTLGSTPAPGHGPAILAKGSKPQL